MSSVLISCANATSCMTNTKDLIPWGRHGRELAKQNIIQLERRLDEMETRIRAANDAVGTKSILRSMRRRSSMSSEKFCKTAFHAQAAP